MPLAEYWAHFRNTVRNNPKAVFHNADLYAPHYGRVRSVTWVETEERATTPTRLQPQSRSYPLHQYFLWAISETPFGKERREKLIDPLLYLGKKVHWRNFEAGYDVAELEPPSRMHRTYVLQEYFVPVERARELRAADAGDPAPAPGQRAQHLDPPCDARHRDHARLGAARDLRLRPLSQAAHAREREEPGRRLDARADRCRARASAAPTTCPTSRTRPLEQFHRAYPRAREFFALKWEVDPELPLHQRALGQVLPRLARPLPARGRGRASERVPPDLRRRRPVGRVLPLPADRLSHRARRPLPSPDRRRLQAASRRGGGLPLRAAGAQGHQALPLRPALHRAVAGQAEAGDGGADPGACSARAGASTAMSRSARRRGTTPAWRRSSTSPGRCHFVDERPPGFSRGRHPRARRRRQAGRARAAARTTSRLPQRRSPTAASTWSPATSACTT